MRKAGLLALVCLTSTTLGLAADRWVHVRVVDNGEDGERVRINIPLSLAEKVLPTIKADRLCNGKVKVNGHDFDEVDLRALLEAVRTAQDNEYVTVESKHENVRVAKSGGFMLIKVRESHHHGKETAKTDSRSGGKGEESRVESVDVKIPFAVVNALLSGEKDELDVVAALRALSEFEDLELVTVNDESSTVRIWVDSRNTAD
jgi:hypothetical protein